MICNYSALDLAHISSAHSMLKVVKAKSGWSWRSSSVSVGARRVASTYWGDDFGKTSHGGRGVSGPHSDIGFTSDSLASTCT